MNHQKKMKVIYLSFDKSKKLMRHVIKKGTPSYRRKIKRVKAFHDNFV